MRGSELIELAGELLPRRVRLVVGYAALVLLLATGTAEAAASWLIQDKTAGLHELFTQLFAPILARFG
jgi:hypothetical protein